MILESRRFESSQAFVERVLATLMSMMLQDSPSIHWDKIYDVVEKYQDALEFFDLLSQTRYSEEFLIPELSNSLLSADEPLAYVETALLLLGFSEIGSTANEIAQNIAVGDIDISDNFAEYLVALGFPHNYELEQLNQNFTNDILAALRDNELRFD